jgi:hypothetical protein
MGGDHDDPPPIVFASTVLIDTGDRFFSNVAMSAAFAIRRGRPAWCRRDVMLV